MKRRPTIDVIKGALRHIRRLRGRGEMLDREDVEMESDLKPRVQQSDIASKPRRAREPGLRVRALRCALDQCAREQGARDREPELTATALIDRVNAEGVWTFDDDDLEMKTVEGGLEVRDLDSDAVETIPEDQLKAYLRRARHSRNK